MHCTWQSYCMSNRRTFLSPIDRCGTCRFDAAQRTGHSRKSRVEQDVERHGRCPDGQRAIVAVKDVSTRSSARQSVHTSSRTVG